MKKLSWPIIDDSMTFDLEHFSIPRHYANDVESILLPHGIILDRVDRLAHVIVNDYHERHRDDDKAPGLVVVCVLKGGHQYFADLLNAIKRINQSLSNSRSIPMSLEFIKVKSYVNDSSSGQVSIELTANETWLDVARRFKDKDILVVEDIIDSGRTMTALLAKLKETQASNVSVTSLFLKRTHLSNGYVPEYVGFSIPDKFIVGYCLDYNEYFRDLDHVCIINENGRLKYKQ